MKTHFFFVIILGIVNWILIDICCQFQRFYAVKTTYKKQLPLLGFLGLYYAKNSYIYSYKVRRYRFAANNWLEFFWTFIPTLMLCAIGLPAFSLIFILEDIYETQDIRLKENNYNIPEYYNKLTVIGHQWFWLYESNTPVLIEQPLKSIPSYKKTKLNSRSFIIHNLSTSHKKEYDEIFFEYAAPQLLKSKTGKIFFECATPQPLKSKNNNILLLLLNKWRDPKLDDSIVLWATMVSFLGRYPSKLEPNTLFNDSMILRLSLEMAKNSSIATDSYFYWILNGFIDILLARETKYIPLLMLRFPLVGVDWSAELLGKILVIGFCDLIKSNSVDSYRSWVLETWNLKDSYENNVDYNINLFDSIYSYSAIMCILWNLQEMTKTPSDLTCHPCSLTTEQEVLNYVTLHNIDFKTLKEELSLLGISEKIFKEWQAKMLLTLSAKNNANKNYEFLANSLEQLLKKYYVEMFEAELFGLLVNDLKKTRVGVLEGSTPPGEYLRLKTLHDFINSNYAKIIQAFFTENRSSPDKCCRLEACAKLAGVSIKGMPTTYDIIVNLPKDPCFTTYSSESLNAFIKVLHAKHAPIIAYYYQTALFEDFPEPWKPWNLSKDFIKLDYLYRHFFISYIPTLADAKQKYKLNLKRNFHSYELLRKSLKPKKVKIVEAYCKNDADLTFKDFRLLSTDNKLFLGIGWVKAFITAADVLHSWTIPSFGIKIDACPGRLNEINFRIDSTGQFFGQCSELCGIGHSFMPINIIVYNPIDVELFAQELNNL